MALTLMEFFAAEVAAAAKGLKRPARFRAHFARNDSVSHPKPGISRAKSRDGDACANVARPQRMIGRPAPTD